MSHHWGYMSALLAAMLFGIGNVISKILLNDLHPLLVAGLIYLVSGVFLVAIRIQSPMKLNSFYGFLGLEYRKFPTLGLRDFKILLGMVFFGAFLAPYIFLYGLQLTTAINASFLSITENIFTILLASLLLGERLRKKEVLSVSVILLGAVFLVTNLEFYSLKLAERLFGNLLVLVGCFLWSVDNVLSRLLSVEGDVIEVAGFKSLIGGLTIVVLCMLLGVPFNLNLVQIVLLVFVGLFSIGFSLVFYFAALHYIGAGKTSTIYATSAVFGAFFAVLILQEKFTFVQAFSGIMMLAGVYALYKMGLDESRLP